LRLFFGETQRGDLSRKKVRRRRGGAKSPVPPANTAAERDWIERNPEGDEAAVREIIGNHNHIFTILEMLGTREGKEKKSAQPRRKTW